MKTTIEIEKLIAANPNSAWVIIDKAACESSMNYDSCLRLHLINAMHTIIELRKENERLKNENHDLYAESKREDLEQEATYEKGEESNNELNENK